MTKQVNFARYETIEGSHRNLTDLVEMYAIYFSDYCDLATKLAESTLSIHSEEYRKIAQQKNQAIREMKICTEELRAIGIDVDLGEHARVDDYFEDAA